MRIAVLTGAGISAESGIATFRNNSGLWEGHRLGDVATPEGFARDSLRVQNFYNARRAAAAAAIPNTAHAALALLGKDPRHRLTLITQNVDDLHERAGSRNVIHMHGTLGGALCAACGHRWEAPMIMRPADLCPVCARPATRPDIVWFGEMPHQMDTIADVLQAADMFVSIGTSGQVYPAAAFVREASGSGAATVELNLEPSAISDAFDTGRYGPATRIVPEWVAQITA